MLNKTIPREIPMKMDDFTSLYNIGRGAIWVRVSQGGLPRDVMLSKGVINHAWFLRRFAFQNYVKELNQSLVYLLEEHFSIEEISRVITKRYGGKQTSIREYLNNTLFSIQGDDIKVATKVHPRAWIVFKYAKLVNNKLKRRGTSIEEVLDLRMKEVI